MSVRHPLPPFARDVAAVVFDFDGTLVDSEPAWERARERVLAAWGWRASRDEVAELFGVASAEVAERTAARCAPGRAAEIARDLEAASRHHLASALPAMPGAPELLAALAAHRPLALASNTERPILTAALAGTPFPPHLSVVVSASDVSRPKPAPDVYLRACELLGVPPRDAVAIEDSPVGMRAALAAGMRVIVVPNTAHPDFRLAHRVAGSLTELLSD